MTTSASTIIYVGPAGQDSPLFGSLVAGRRYQTDEAMASYLCAQHPTYWQRPPADPPKVPAPKE